MNVPIERTEKKDEKKPHEACLHRRIRRKNANLFLSFFAARIGNRKTVDI
jgi:hypothetical protein